MSCIIRCYARWVSYRGDGGRDILLDEEVAECLCQGAAAASTSNAL